MWNFKIFGMKVGISYCSTKYYDVTNIMQWVWMFKRYRNVKGIIFRIFGVYVNIREINATKKLIEIARNGRVNADKLKQPQTNTGAE